jgi:hypothetical protein
LITLIVPIFAFGEPLLFRLTNFRCEFSVIDVCFCSHNGLNSDIAPHRKSADFVAEVGDDNGGAAVRTRLLMRRSVICCTGSG